MPGPSPPRFQVRDLLAAARAGEPPFDAGVDAAEVEDVARWFRHECALLVAGVPDELLPLRLPKDRIAGLLACEAGTLARLGGDRDHMAEALVMGRLADLLVAQHVTTGLTDDVEGDLRDALAARLDSDVLAWLDDAGDEGRARVWEHARLVAAGLHSSWGPIDRSWWPRPQERLTVEVAGGALVLSSVFDLSLGGPGTGLPWIVVEVKSGRATDRHRADLYWYALVAALRHRRSPALVATWTGADDALVPLPVGPGALGAAAERGLAALGRLVELAVGRVPAVTPHLGCRWCPRVDLCAPGTEFLAAVGRGDDPWDPERWDAGPDDDEAGAA